MHVNVLQPDITSIKLSAVQQCYDLRCLSGVQEVWSPRVFACALQHQQEMQSFTVEKISSINSVEDKKSAGQ